MYIFQDELQTTTKSYEGQLSMMSEHLAGMNEKLTLQKDEIDALKYQMNNSKVTVDIIRLVLIHIFISTRGAFVICHWTFFSSFQGGRKGKK